MKTSIRSLSQAPIIWEEPPVSKEEALSPHTSPNHSWTPDGYDGGSELPDDFEIDRMVYPHDAGPIEAANDKRHHDRHMQTAQIQHEAFERSRNFDITIGNKTGENPGPPSMFDEKE